MSDYIEFIPKAGACLATTNVIERQGKIRWMVRVPSTGGADDGWQIMSDIDTSDYLNDGANWQIVDYNDVCNIEPALVGIWDFEVGSDLQIVHNERGITIYDNPTGLPIPEDNFYVPPQFRA